MNIANSIQMLFRLLTTTQRARSADNYVFYYTLANNKTFRSHSCITAQYEMKIMKYIMRCIFIILFIMKGIMLRTALV